MPLLGSWVLGLLLASLLLFVYGPPRVSRAPNQANDPSEQHDARATEAALLATSPELLGEEPIDAAEDAPLLRVLESAANGSFMTTVEASAAEEADQFVARRSACSARARRLELMLLHVPKAGGTTLGCTFAEPGSALRALCAWDLGGALWSTLEPAVSREPIRVTVRANHLSYYELARARAAMTRAVAASAGFAPPPCAALIVLVSDPVRRLASAFRHSVSREAAAHAAETSPFGQHMAEHLQYPRMPWAHHCEGREDYIRQ